MIKTIKINSTDCKTILKFHERKYPVIPWNVELETSTPNLTGYISGQVSDEDVKVFIEDLTEIEKKRTGQCYLGLGAESGFALTIKSLDSLGHFAVTVKIEDHREINKNTQINKLEIAYEIEPSSLITFLENFKKLDK